MAPERAMVPTLGNTALEYVTDDVIVTEVMRLHYFSALYTIFCSNYQASAIWMAMLIY
jgi:hypothetical protein